MASLSFVLERKVRRYQIQTRFLVMTGNEEVAKFVALFTHVLEYRGVGKKQNQSSRTVEQYIID